VVFATDITEEWNRRNDAEERERRLNIALSAAEQGVWDYNLETGEIIYSARAKEIYGLPDDQPVTFEQIRDATHPADYPNTSALMLRAIDPAIRDRSSYEYRILRPDGSICWALAYGEAVFEGSPGAEVAKRYVGTIQDISERKQAEARQRLLVAELNHRVKNTLAIVQSFAHQSLGSGRSLTEGREAFEARLSALATAHDLLTTQSWDEIGLATLVENSLRAHDDGAERVVINGPNLRLTPKTAVTLAMTLHELATNATKYGALSVPGGTVRLDWSYDHGSFRLIWQERDGPAVARPTQRGFGTRMLERALAAEFGGRTSLTYSPKGFRFELEAETQEPL
jgi:PAS domain S-box-containing protein